MTRWGPTPRRVVVALVALGMLVAAAPASAYLRDFQITYSGHFDALPVKAVSATCLPGKQAIGGGGWVRPAHINLGLHRLSVNGPTAFAGAGRTGPGFSGSYINVQAYCATSVGIVPLGGGAPFLKQRQLTSARGVFDSRSPKSQAALCPAGSSVIGGGGQISSASPDIALTEMFRISDGAWRVSAHEVDFTNVPWSLTAYAICANTTTVPPGASFVGGAGIFTPDTGPGPLRFGTTLPAFARCPPNGTKIIGGGALLTGATAGSPPPADVVLIASVPTNDTMWGAQARDTQPPFQGYRLQVSAVCG